jgi:hypothetical protein
MKHIISAWPHGWVSILVVKLYLTCAVIVLLGARVFRNLGLLSPGGIGLALQWSEMLVQRGMKIWRVEWARAVRRKR